MLSDGTIVVDNATLGWSAASFNGFKLTDLSQSPGFSSLNLVSITGNVTPIAPATSFNADQLSVNFTPTGVANIASGSGQEYTFSFTTAMGENVPDVGSTILLLGCGLLCTTVLARYRGIRQEVTR